MTLIELINNKNGNLTIGTLCLIASMFQYFAHVGWLLYSLVFFGLANIVYFILSHNQNKTQEVKKNER